MAVGRRYSPVVPAGPTRRSDCGPPWLARIVARTGVLFRSRSATMVAHARLPTRRSVRAHRGPAGGDRAPRRRAPQGAEAPDAAGSHGHGQDLLHRPGDRGLPAADPRPRPQQDPGRPALRRVPGVLSGQRGRVLRQLLRLLPARGLPAAERHVHREGLVAQRRDRPPPPRRDPRPVRAPRRDHRGLRLVHLRPRRAGRLRGDGPPPPDRRLVSPRRRPPPPRRPPVPAQRPGPPACPLPGPGRHARVPAGVRGDPRPRRVLRRRGRADHRARPAHRGTPRRAQGGQRLPGQPLRHAPGQAEARPRRHRGRDGGAGRRDGGRGPGPRGGPPPPADDVRSRDDARARVTAPASRTTRAICRDASRGRDRGRSSTTSRRTGSSSSTSRT